MGEIGSAKVSSVSRTHRSVDGVDILEVTIMVQTAKRVATGFTGKVYDDRVELQGETERFGVDDEALKELMAGAANRWEQDLADLEGEVGVE